MILQLCATHDDSRAWYVSNLRCKLESTQRVQTSAEDFHLLL